MTVETDPAVQAINDARALLDELLLNGWQEMHLVSGNTEIFAARQGGGVNPMRAGAPVAANLVVDPVAALAERQVTAPHVLTLVDTVEIGRVVAAGDSVATIRVLDEEVGVKAPVAGTVIKVNAVAGQLVDYGSPLVTIAEVA